MFTVPWSLLMPCEVWRWTERTGNYTGAVSHAKTQTHTHVFCLSLQVSDGTFLVSLRVFTVHVP